MVRGSNARVLVEQGTFLWYFCFPLVLTFTSLCAINRILSPLLRPPGWTRPQSRSTVSSVAGSHNALILPSTEYRRPTRTTARLFTQLHHILSYHINHNPRHPYVPPPHSPPLPFTDSFSTNKDGESHIRRKLAYINPQGLRSAEDFVSIQTGVKFLLD